MLHLRDYQLSNLTSIKIGGIAADFFAPENAAELCEICTVHPEAIVVGNGSNVVFGDLRTRPVISLRGLDSQEPVVSENPDFAGKILATVGTGLPLPLFVNWAAEHGYAGLERLAGIPGTIGGAIAMNASAGGSAISDCLCGVEILQHTANNAETIAPEVIYLPKETLEFSYRHSALQDDGYFSHSVAVSAVFALCHGNRDELLAAVHRAIASRPSTKITLPNCGSVFKNPSEEITAGRLLDEAGLKGTAVGGLRVSREHANFFENTGGATFADFQSLLQQAVEAVRARAGITLVPEVKIYAD